MFVRRKRLREAIEACDKLLEECEKLKNKAYLIDIQQQGRKKTFLFSKGNEIHKIQTMSLLSDNFEKWRKDLLG